MFYKYLLKKGEIYLEDNILLRISGITKVFPGTKALSEVGLTVKKGEIHALMGENGAGKSTLMNIIAGVFPQDEGTIYFDGKEVYFNNPKEAQEAGIGFVHQELSLCPHLSVAENVYIGRLPKAMGDIVDFVKLHSDCEEALRIFKTNVKPQQKVNELNVAEQQVVEIAKATSFNCKLLILDEPTSSLTEAETEVLFDVIRHLKSIGISILYISHRMAEIFRICDTISVLRDGQYVGTVDVKDTDSDNIIKMMVGRTISNLYPQKSTDIGDELLKVENFSTEGIFKDINFTLRKGEVLGFAGLVGSGRSEIMRAICGIDPKSSGEVYLEGKKIDIKNYRDSIDAGIGYLTEDRKAQGLFLNLSVLKNVTAACLKKAVKGLLIKKEVETAIGEKYVKILNIKVANLNQPVNSLSGGNQQKGMIARWLAIEPKIIIMDEPTRGIDVGSKAEIHKLLRQLVKDGIGVIMISSEMPEIIGMCDRVAVVHEGRITGILESNELQEERIMAHASGKTA